MARVKGDHQLGRTAIAEAAAVALIRKGMENTSLRDIAGELGSTTGRIRHYFKNKDDLLVFTKNLFVERMFQSMQQAADTQRGVEKLIAMGVEMLPLSRLSKNAWQLLSVFKGTAIANPTLLNLQIKRTLDGWSMFADEIAALQNAKEISSSLDSQMEGIALCAFLEGLAEQVTFAPGHLDNKRVENLVRKYVRQTLQ